MTEVTKITSKITATVEGKTLDLYDSSYGESLTLDWDEIAALRLYLERNPQLGTANLEPSGQLGTEPPTWNHQELAKYLTSLNLRLSPIETPQNETAEFRRTLTVTVAARLLSHDPVAAVRWPGGFAKEVAGIVGQIVAELEGADGKSTCGDGGK